MRVTNVKYRFCTSTTPKKAHFNMEVFTENPLMNTEQKKLLIPMNGNEKKKTHPRANFGSFHLAILAK